MASPTQVANFIAQIGPLVQKYARGSGYKIASTVIAQACCESAFGTSWISKAPYWNMFGMKCGGSWKGRSVSARTKEEYSPGVLTSITDNFRAYDSLEEGVAGYYGFIAAKRYANLKTATTYRQYAEFLKADGYATSSTYVNTLCKIVETYNLTVWDNFDAQPQVVTPAPVPAAAAPSYTVGKLYTLQVELNVRKGPGTNWAKKGWNQLTTDGKRHDKDRDGALDPGTKVTCLEVKKVGANIWIRCPSGWLAAYFNGKVYIK